MAVVSITSLIYASPRHAAHMWDMLRRTTPEIESGEAEFFFVANDATPEVLAYLEREQIPHIVQNNERLTESELVALGIGKPEYMRRVYQGLNRSVQEARADCLVLLSSDHVLLPGWLKALREQWTPDIALTALTIEPKGEYGIFTRDAGCGTGAVRGDHGNTLDSFDAEAFTAHARSLTRDHMTPGGAHQPTMVSRAAVIAAGLYPEGNLHGGTFDNIEEYGDRRLFQILDSQGVRHVTYHGVVAYHFQTGEMREVQD